MMVYLAGAIDLVSAGEAREWRSKASEVLGANGIGTYDPSRAFGAVNLESALCVEALIRINEGALRACQTAIFVMRPTTPSIGTPMELMLCKQLDIPSFVVWDTSDWSKPLPAYLSFYATKIVASVEAAVEQVIKRV